MSINSKLVMSTALLGAIILIGFQNCSPANYEFQTADKLSSSGETVVPAPIDEGDKHPEDPEDISYPHEEEEIEPPAPEPTPTPTSVPPTTEDEIADSCSSGNLQTLKTQVKFAPPSNIAGTNSACAWGQFGNLSTKDTYVRARGEQVVNLDIPADAHVCKMRFNFPSQSFQYDDQIILTYRGAALATSMRPFLDKFTKQDSVFLYDWSKLVGTDGYVSRHDPYCVGQESGLSSCVIPKTQTTGQIDLNIDDRIFYQIAEKRFGTSHNFNLITTGDNDLSSDCKHAGFSFDVEIQYYQHNAK